MGSKKMDPEDVQQTDRGYSCAQCGGRGDTSGTIKHNCPKCKYCDGNEWDSTYDPLIYQQQQQRLRQQQQNRSQRQAGR